MPRLWCAVAVFVIAVNLTGCGIKARAYLTRKERVDQDQSGPKKTRQVVVVELVKSEKQKNLQLEQENASKPVDPLPVDDKIVNQEQDVSGQYAGPRAETYIVQKDDTLQKIAKKFYNSYGKWTIIYQANRQNIKDPNFLKPGIELTIPRE